MVPTSTPLTENFTENAKLLNAFISGTIHRVTKIYPDKTLVVESQPIGEMEWQTSLYQFMHKPEDEINEQQTLWQRVFPDQAASLKAMIGVLKFLDRCW
jgi:hypothetical protein